MIIRHGAWAHAFQRRLGGPRPLDAMTTTRPEIVCLCGSARFASEMRAASRDLSLRGAIVLAPVEMDEVPGPEQKDLLDALHR